MMSCKETARLLSESRDRRLSFREQISFRMHMVLCRMCQVYARQFASLARIYRAAADRAPDCCPGELPEARKAIIRSRMMEEPRDL